MSNQFSKNSNAFLVWIIDHFINFLSDSILYPFIFIWFNEIIGCIKVGTISPTTKHNK